MEKHGLNHQKMTSKQRELFKELYESGRPKDYLVDSLTGRVYGHAIDNPHGMYPHINIKRTDGKTVLCTMEQR